MTAARLKRLERLERRKPATDWWRDDFEVAFALLVRFEAGDPPPFEHGPPSEVVWLAMRDYDKIAERLRAQKPG